MTNNDYLITYFKQVLLLSNTTYDFFYGFSTILSLATLPAILSLSLSKLRKIVDPTDNNCYMLSSTFIMTLIQQASWVRLMMSVIQILIYICFCLESYSDDVVKIIKVVMEGQFEIGKLFENFIILTQIYEWCLVINTVAFVKNKLLSEMINYMKYPKN